jgi:type IV pilus biogenesis protein CpaD/CtpE
MKNTILNRNTVNLAVVALLTLLFAGCAAENLSMGTTAAHMRTTDPAIAETDDLQPNPSDSPKFYQWGDMKNVGE